MSINKGSVPCLENAVTALAQIENSAAVQKAAEHYSQQMAQRVSFPTDTLQELLDVHMACEREAIAIFMENSFKDDQREFQKKLIALCLSICPPYSRPSQMMPEIIKNKKESFLQKNEEASVKYCQNTLDQLSMELVNDILEGNFSVPGGHENYRRAKERIERRYWEVPRKGVKAKEVFQDFLQSQMPIEKSILQADRTLTQGQKAIEEEQARKEAAEMEKEWLRQKHWEQQQQMEAQNRSLQENMVQLREKLEWERDEALREQTKTLEHKLKTQEEFLNNGFKKKADEMKAEINHLRSMIENTKKSKTPFKSQTLDTFADQATAVLSIPANLIGMGLKALSSLFK
ncbi:guanylate-binding protein 6-like [Saccopteryx leptura]|uniref:guanylate-binding protein 6-like n=1 Tax=Saccopteryx leptura TaxID=249018 RepID=UPI00339D119F